MKEYTKPIAEIVYFDDSILTSDDPISGGGGSEGGDF